MRNAGIPLGSGLDPTGVVNYKDGHIVREINPEFSAFFESLMENQVIQKMLGDEIIDTAIQAQGNQSASLILSHKEIHPVSYPYEWPSSMIHRAAHLTIDISLALLEENLILKDATPWNILFEYGKPILVDFGSINSLDPDLVWVALDQFYRLFLFPLLACEFGYSRTVRAILRESQNGITSEEIGQFIPRFAWLRKPWLVNRLYLPRMIVRMLQKSGMDKSISRQMEKTEVLPNARKKFLEKLKRDLNAISVDKTGSRWSTYYADINTFFEPGKFNRKQATVAKILTDLQEETVTDIGCNMGGYSILAEKSGSKVIAFDADEDSVNLLYKLVMGKKLKILPLVLDVTNPSPRTGYRAAQYPSAIERFQSQGALALALVHHLAITQGQPFGRIAAELADYCQNWLLTEFVPIDDPRTVELMVTSRKDFGWYTLENYVAELNRLFRRITTFESHPSGRTLILCENKIDLE